MKTDLSARLNRLKQTKGLPVASETKEAVPLISSDLSDLPKGWRSAGPDVWMREVSDPNPLANLDPTGYLAPLEISPEEWLFFDTETTGLSGGAGNTAFLIGIGRVRGDRFITTQYFLKDYPGEPFLLDLLKNEFRNTGLFISYNGKSYDSHLLQTRFLMNRMPFQFGAQLDLLYPVRQLYKRTLPNCRLGTVEAFLLGNPRQGDIPGAEIPDIWFSFLKNKQSKPLLQVFNHNYLDIIRMAELLVFLEAVLRGKPQGLPYRDQFALGRFLLERGDARGLEYMESAVRRGDPRAETFLSIYWKRLGKWEKASSLWIAILQKRPGLYAGVEMAKFLEHRERDYTGALTLVEKLLRELPILNPERRAQLQHRRNRLIAKIAKEAENTSYE